MTRKDYVLIARAVSKAKATISIKDSVGAHMENAIKRVAESLAMELRIDNPNFKRDRFMEACGFTE